MAKIEEITAMLIEEINTFEKAVIRLQSISTKVENVKLKIDTSTIENKFSGLLKKIDNSNREQQQELLILQKKLNKTIIFPKWMTVLFSLFFFLFITSISFNFYQQKTNIGKTEKSYQKGKNEVYNKMQLFFNQNPKALKEYKNWVKK